MSRLAALPAATPRIAKGGTPFQWVKWLIIGAAILLLLGIVAWPLAWLMKYSLTSADGHFTLDTFRAALNEPGMLQAALNSVRLVISVVINTTVIGTLLAWIVARTDTPCKGLIVGAAGVTFVIPTFITVIAWLFLAAPNSGYLNVWLMHAFDLQGPPLNIISFNGLVLIETLHLYPLVFFSVLSALNNVDASFEQAARVLGAGRLRTTLTITLPLVLPAILASTILVMLDTLSSFGAPSVIGTMANFSVLTTRLYALMTFPPQLNMAAAIAVPIVLYTLACLAAQRLVIGRDDFRTLSGKAGQGQALALGGLRWVMLAIVVAVLLLSVILPVFSLGVLSLTKTLGLGVAWPNLALSNYRTVLAQGNVAFGALKNSLLLAVATATLCACLAAICAWVVERTRLAGRGAITVLIMIAYGFPSIAFGVGLMLGYVSVLYGTLTLLLIAYTAKQLPVAFVLARTALRQIAVELEEAARIAGAGWLRVMLDITLPLLKVSLGIGWVLVFSLSVRELSMSVMLAQTDSQVLSTVIMQYISDGSIELGAAISILIIAISILVLAVVRKTSGGALSLRDS